MIDLDRLSTAEAKRLVGVVFDLDDTVLDHGALGLDAYAALFALRDAGLARVACTGRPSGWGEVIARQWPVDAVIVENGALAWMRGADGRVTSTDTLSPDARRARRRRLEDVADELIARFPDVERADDNRARLTDVTLDIGEHRVVPRATVDVLRAAAARAGVRTHASSVHVHLTLEPDDKASGIVRLLVDRFAEDATAARARWAFVGDSGNDAQAFAAFTTSFGVANVVDHSKSLTVLPRFLASRAMGAGFAEVAAGIVERRALLSSPVR